MQAVGLGPHAFQRRGPYAIRVRRGIDRLEVGVVQLQCLVEGEAGEPVRGHPQGHLLGQAAVECEQGKRAGALIVDRGELEMGHRWQREEQVL